MLCSEAGQACSPCARGCAVQAQATLLSSTCKPQQCLPAPGAASVQRAAGACCPPAPVQARHSACRAPVRRRLHQVHALMPAVWGAAPTTSPVNVTFNVPVVLINATQPNLLQVRAQHMAGCPACPMGREHSLVTSLERVRPVGCARQCAVLCCARQRNDLWPQAIVSLVLFTQRQRDVPRVTGSWHAGVTRHCTLISPCAFSRRAHLMRSS